MKVKRLIYFCYIVLFSSLGINLHAQEADTLRFQAKPNQELEEEEEKEPKKKIDHDLRVGFDIHNYFLGAIVPSRKGFDLNVEYNLNPKYSVLLEGGYNYFERDNDKLIYTSKGNYIRAGIDYNLRSGEAVNDRDNFYIGIRYGFSLFTQEVPEYFLNNDYYGNRMLSLAPVDGYAHWAEFLTGFKVEVIKNWYLGMNLRFKTFIHRSKKGIEPVQFVPGYSQNYNSLVVDFNYTISYNIPLNYKKLKRAVYEKN